MALALRCFGVLDFPSTDAIWHDAILGRPMQPTRVAQRIAETAEGPNA